MKAKNTVMSRNELSKINNAMPPEAKYGDVFQAIAQAQFEITLSAGCKQIGQWLVDHPPNNPPENAELIRLFAYSLLEGEMPEAKSG